MFVARRGFEPLSFSRITDRPKPLDERAIFILSYKDKKIFLIYQIFFYFFQRTKIISDLFYKDKVTFSFHQIFFYFFFKIIRQDSNL